MFYEEVLTKLQEFNVRGRRSHRDEPPWRNLKAFTFIHSLRPLQEVGFLLASPISFEEADRAKKILTAGHLSIPVISLDHLIAMKRVAGRAQDAADVEALERLKRLLGGSG